MSILVWFPKTALYPVITPTVPSLLITIGLFAPIAPDIVEAVAVNPLTPVKALPSPE